MSYSFNVRGANKAEAKAKVAEELAKAVASQPIHAIDQPQAQAAANAFIDLLGDDLTKDVTAGVNGSTWARDGITQQSSVSVNAGLSPKL